MRRAPEDAWRRRDSTAAPLVWSVTAWLHPEEDLLTVDLSDARPRWTEAVALAASRCDAGWDRSSLDSYLEDLGAARFAAARGEEAGWDTIWPPAFAVTFLETASTAAEAVRQGSARFEPPPGFRTNYRTHPADRGPDT
jgi:hypothetical protein